MSRSAVRVRSSALFFADLLGIPTFAARMRGWHSWQEADARGTAFAAEAYKESVVTVTCPELVSKIKSDNMMLARPPQEYELHEYGRILYT